MNITNKELEKRIDYNRLRKIKAEKRELERS